MHNALAGVLQAQYCKLARQDHLIFISFYSQKHYLNVCIWDNVNLQKAKWCFEDKEIPEAKLNSKRVQ